MLSYKNKEAINEGFDSGQVFPSAKYNVKNGDLVIVVANDDENNLIEGYVIEKTHDVPNYIAKRTFKPELLNRLDDMIVFSELSKEDLEIIISIELSNIQNRTLGRNIELKINKSAKEFLLKKVYYQLFLYSPASQLWLNLRAFLHQ